MSKIISAINVMISNAERISHIRPYKHMYFFLYEKKHKWTIFQQHDAFHDQDDYILWYLPGDETIEEMISLLQSSAWNEYDRLIIYTSQELKTREARESMQELYTVVKEKAYNVDQSLDEIINGDPYNEMKK